MPLSIAACRTVLPLGTVTALPSIVSVTLSISLSSYYPPTPRQRLNTDPLPGLRRASPCARGLRRASADRKYPRLQGGLSAVAPGRSPRGEGGMAFTGELIYSGPLFGQPTQPGRPRWTPSVFRVASASRQSSNG